MFDKREIALIVCSAVAGAGITGIVVTAKPAPRNGTTNQLADLQKEIATANTQVEQLKQSFAASQSLLAAADARADKADQREDQADLDRRAVAAQDTLHGAEDALSGNNTADLQQELGEANANTRAASEQVLEQRNITHAVSASCDGTLSCPFAARCLNAAKAAGL